MRRSRARIGLLAGLLAWFQPALAAGLVVQVTDTRGRPVADAVVMVAAPAGAAAAAPPQTRTIDQKDETFVPYVEVFRPGDSVVFNNSDGTRHHVYSFAPAKSFEFVLRPGQQSPPLMLERLGAVSVGCNIHDRMITHLYVTEADRHARTDASGSVRFDELVPGLRTISVWHPQLRPGSSELRREVELGATGLAQPVAFALPLVPDPRGIPDRERAPY